MLIVRIVNIEEGGMPVVDDPEASPDATYRSLLDRRVLGYQRCDACERAVFPPRWRCPHCQAAALAWHDSRGLGTVYSATQLSPRDQPAYAVVLVDLDEGFRMMSRLDGVGAEPVAIGDRVQVTFVEVAEQLQPFVTRELASTPVGAA